MKKFALCLAIFASLMMVPFSAFGLQMMNNNSMDQITGQAGVSIAFDDVQIFMNINRFTYIDVDGITSSGGWATTLTGIDHGAAFNINQFQIDTLKANAIINTAGVSSVTIEGKTLTAMNLSGVNVKTKIVSSNSIPLQYTYGDTTAFIAQTTKSPQTLGMNNMFGNGYSKYMPQAISIDITDAAPVLTAGLAVLHSGASSRMAAVVITLPTAEFYIDNINIGSMTLTDNVISGATAVYPTTISNNSGASFGSIEMQGVDFTLLNGWIEIAPHN
jgi:hypothetical protein